MKTINIVLLTLLCLVVQTKAQRVEFNYDFDGNMIERKMLVLDPQHVKSTPKVQEEVIAELGEQKITLYPNPTKGMFQIAITLLDTDQKNYFHLYSLSGSRLLEKKISGEYTNIDISKYPTGTYLLDVFLGDKVSRWKVIKQ